MGAKEKRPAQVLVANNLEAIMKPLDTEELLEEEEKDSTEHASSVDHKGTRTYKCPKHLNTNRRKQGKVRIT